MYKALIGLDLDGTVLTDEKIFTRETARIIERSIEKGYMVIPNTGRPLTGVPVEFLEIKGVDYVVTANGAEIYRRKMNASGEAKANALENWECIFRNPMLPEVIDRVLDLTEQYFSVPDVMFRGMGNCPAQYRERVGKLGLSKGVEDYILNSKNYVPDIRALAHENLEEIVKITINFRLSEEGAADKAQAQKILSALPEAAVVSGAPQNLEVTRAGNGKGSGLLKLAELLGIDAAKTVAIGDSENDLDMIEKAGFSIAMQNSEKCVLDIADYIAGSNNEDGCAKAIEYYIALQEKEE